MNTAQGERQITRVDFGHVTHSVVFILVEEFIRTLGLMQEPLVRKDLFFMISSATFLHVKLSSSVFVSYLTPTAELLFG